MTERSHDPRRFFAKAEQDRIVAAIGAAEQGTSAEIRLFLERDLRPAQSDPYHRAREIFARLGMHETAEHNGVLIYLAIRSRRFAIVGDELLHQRVDDDFWTGVRDQLAAEFAADRFIEGLETGLATLGESLARFFPPHLDDTNELPDDIAY